MSADVARHLFPAGVVLFFAVLVWYWQSRSPKHRLEWALEAAEAGDTKDTLHQLEHLLKGWKKKPEAWYSPMFLASHIVPVACEWEWPETAEAVLRHLNLTRRELMWEEEGKPAIPLLEYVQNQPEFLLTAAFLQQEP